MKLKLRKISLIIGIAALALCLAGCGNEAEKPVATDEDAPSKESMIESAQEFNYSDFIEACSNEAKAKSEYDGKVFKHTAYVTEVKTDECILEELIAGKEVNPLFVELPSEELEKLSIGEEVTVIGVFAYEDKPNISRLSNAFLVE